MPSYHISTFGCQMNYSDTERVAQVIQNLGYHPTPEFKAADLIIFNTCSIRQKAEDRVYGQMSNIKAMKKRNQHLLVGITGCMVRKSSTRYSNHTDSLLNNLSPVDFVFRIEELGMLPSLLKEIKPDLKINLIQSDELENYFKINPIYTSKFQAFVPIMKGCDKFCTYCIVPYSRGREQGRPIEEILKEVHKLVALGCLEITLLGQNVNSYGKSILDKHHKRFSHIKGSPFAHLLRELNKIKALKRVRFTSPHPQDMCDEVIEACSTLRVMCPYVHLPVQSGDNHILKKMNRTYTREHYFEIVEKFRKYNPAVAISTDVIVGFSGETEAQFKNTLSLFEKVEFDQAYIAKYSPRKGTYAERNFPDDIPLKEKTNRWRALNDLLEKISLKKHQSYEGKTVEVLVENCENGICEGRSAHFKQVKFSGSADHIGTLQPIRVNKGLEWLLEGELLTL